VRGKLSVPIEFSCAGYAVAMMRAITQEPLSAG